MVFQNVFVDVVHAVAALGLVYGGHDNIHELSRVLWKLQKKAILSAYRIRRHF